MDWSSLALIKAKEYTKWSNINDKMPSIKSDDPEEKKLAIWYKGYTRNNNGVKEYPEVNKYLEENLHYIKETKDDRALQTAEEYVKYYKNTGKQPTIKDNAKLTRWFHSVYNKDGYIMTNAYLNKHIPQKKKAIDQAMEYVMWFNEKGKPKRTVKDKDETRLATWLKNYLSQNKRNDEIDEMLINNNII
jgi:hypothetical protein